MMVRYPSYKPSGIEWLGKIPEHWEVIPLKHNCYMKGRIGWQGLKQSEFIDEGPFLITGMNFLNGMMNWEDCYHISEERYREDPAIHVAEGDVLITKDGTIGKLLFIDHLPGRTTLNSHLLIIRSLNKRYDSKYLYYQLSSKYFNSFIDQQKTGTTFYGISQNALENYRSITPSFQEQVLIKNYLDNKTQFIDTLIAKKQKLIELLKEYRTAIINRAVTKGLDPNVKMKDSGIEWLGEVPENWEVIRIHSLGRFSKGRGISKEQTLPIGLPCIRYGEIYTKYDRIVYSTISFISHETSNQSESIKKGDVLFTGSGETIEDIGKSVVYYGDGEIFVGGDIIILRLIKEVHPVFISYLMNCHYVIFQKSLVGKGEIIVHIYSKDLKDIIISIPGYNEQNQIVNYLDKKTADIDAQIEKEKKFIEYLKEYRTALISEVVTGKVDVRDYSLNTA